VALVLLVYAFLSNVALAVVPHEAVVVWYGPRLGIWRTAAVATVGTLAASWTDHRLFAPVIGRALARDGWHTGLAIRVARAFRRAPFAIIALSGLMPLPFAPFKLVAFAARYPLKDYLAAVAAGRFPRYLLLAWLGTAFTVPTWALAAAFGLFLLPSLGSWLWQRVRAN
jgi:membrane protein YqaA with SNARE-associated domain